ncbi:MAG TPA: glycosyltransferase family A protein [Thermoanaerobaculia bacterium]|nr:glycosyltransferase family A protein [Thermoanaerobaculia bacterium]
MKLTFILPTRNRAELAMAAIRSLLAQEGCDVEILVSDNSSSDDELRRLEEFVRGADDDRVAYLRPPRELRMAGHWNWIAEQALAREDVTHVALQYDRKVWKPGALRALIDACERDPEATLTYGCDVSLHSSRGRTALAYPGSGKLYEIRTRRVVELTARAMIGELEQAFPVFANSIVPRATLERMRARFGSICESAMPDSAFAYRFCATEDRYVHFDAAPVVAYAYEKSNGLAYFRGDASGTYGDWMRLWGNDAWLDAAPVPNLPLGPNVMFHEYALVQRAAGEERFPRVDFPAYLRVLAVGLASIENPALRAELRAVLERHGWAEERRSLLRRLASRLRAPFRRAAPPAPEFATDAEAVQHLLAPRPFLPKNPNLAALKPVEVAAR